MNTLIVTQYNDLSSDKVIDYIKYYGKEVVRLNVEENIKSITIKINNKKFKSEIKNKLLCTELSNFSNFWYRRGSFSFVFPFSEYSMPFNYPYEYLKEEWCHINFFLFKHLPFLGSDIHETYNNRILNTVYAQQSGLKIPDTIITTSKKNALTFYEKNKKIITKPINNQHINFRHHNTSINSMGTQLVTKSDIEHLDDSFAPMLLQVYIEKIIEIRVFFFENLYFPMAIFSQYDEQTKIDYRNYNTTKPNRCVRFKLPHDVEHSLMKLSSKIGINTGSYDLILNNKGEYVFIEVNPSGQFDGLSMNCNYYIEEKIAKFLNLEKM